MISEEYLRSQLTAFEIRPDATAALATVYHRRLARHLWKRLADQRTPPAGVDGWRRLTWLHPQAVKMASVGPVVLGAFDADDAHGTLYTLDGGAPRPPLEHLPRIARTQWVEESVGQLERDVKTVDEAQSLTPSHQLAQNSGPYVDEAADVLARVWPEAAREFRTLVQSIVYVDGKGFRSATIQDTFGAIYAAPVSLGSVAAAFEMLLHETGHHALILRSSFGQFVLNGSAMATHPLRLDPRPINGVLHAAHVLARMATGLYLWSLDPGAPDEARQRRDDAIEGLAQCLDVLDREAQWTPQGMAYFTELRGCSDALRAGRPEPVPAGTPR